jgi:hypothetical protein
MAIFDAGYDTTFSASDLPGLPLVTIGRRG